MADNDQNDEYKFDELDSLNNDSMGDYGLNEPQPSGLEPKPPKKDVKRNAIIAVCIILFVMVLYKVLGGFFSGKSNTVAKGSIPSAPINVGESQVQSQPVQAEIQPIQPIVQKNDLVLARKVDSIETNQQNIQSQVSSMNEQAANINNNINNLSTQINKLNQTITDLTTQLNRQSEEISVLMDRTKPKPIRRMTRSYHQNQASIYYINAVIPGRAWLINTNGSTLTVREGTKIAGYGVVKLIDSIEGRILTSSGRIIRFSQEDS
ncbi:type IVB secretion system protein IcmG/DotF [Legionella sp.]|uniref:type IVB secretion system protein IcmG/DotF n=1 Tax=Legionella sp. TaxID=459 RepID=UPI003CBD2B7C